MFDALKKNAKGLKLFTKRWEVMAGSSQVGEGKQVRLPEEEKPDLEHLVQVHRHPDSPIVRCLCPKLAAGAPPPYFCVQSSTLIAPTCAVTRPNHHQSCCHGDTPARFHHLPYISWSLAVCDSGNVCRQPTIPPLLHLTACIAWQKDIAPWYFRRSLSLGGILMFA